MKPAMLLDVFSDVAAPSRMPNIGGLIGVGFCGGGGSSWGLKRVGLKVHFAMNHDAAAIAMHEANCPEAMHFKADIWHVHPETVHPGRPIRAMWFSPDCKHFSKAKGGKPVEKKIRDLAWVIVLWAKLRRPDVIWMENVEEFETWGPIDKEGQPIKARAGEYFRDFVRELKRLGYDVDFRRLRSCDYGDPTIRLRMYGQFRCDGEPIVWPEPTHGAPTDPRVITGELLPWRTAADSVIDWSEPCYSIFLTRQEVKERGLRLNRPLVDATMGRITLGLQRWVLEAAKPYMVPITHRTWANRTWPTDEPARTQTCSKGGEHALAVPSLAPLTHQGAHRVYGVQEPTRTMTAAHRGEIALQAAHMVKFRRDSAGSSVEEPAPAMTANSFQVRPGCASPVGLSEASLVRCNSVAAHIAQHNAGPRNDALSGRPADQPLSTLATAGAQQNLVTSHLVHLRGTGDRYGNEIVEPVVTQTAGGTHLAEVRTFLVKYYSSAEHGQPADEPIHAQTTKPRFGLVEVSTSDVELTEEQRYSAYWVARLIDVYGKPGGLSAGKRRKRKSAVRHATLLQNLEAMHPERPSAVGRDGWLVWDIGMRMLTVRERFRAQGVGDDFDIDVCVDGKAITATKQGEMCGNMVTPGVAAAIATASLPELRASMEMAA